MFYSYPITFNLNGKTNSTLARWSPFEFISDSTSLTPLFTAKKTINYALTGIKDGCRINDIIQIRVIQLQNIPPNSFSPNGDKINDVWEIPFLDDFITARAIDIDSTGIANQFCLKTFK